MSNTDRPGGGKPYLLSIWTDSTKTSQMLTQCASVQVGVYTVPAPLDMRSSMKFDQVLARGVEGLGILPAVIGSYSSNNFKVVTVYIGNNAEEAKQYDYSWLVTNFDVVTVWRSVVQKFLPFQLVWKGVADPQTVSPKGPSKKRISVRSIAEPMQTTVTAKAAVRAPPEGGLLSPKLDGSQKTKAEAIGRSSNGQVMAQSLHVSVASNGPRIVREAGVKKPTPGDDMFALYTDYVQGGTRYKELSSKAFKASVSNFRDNGPTFIEPGHREKFIQILNDARLAAKIGNV